MSKRSSLLLIGIIVVAGLMWGGGGWLWHTFLVMHGRH
jgi:hypothetical protein